jgi:hypothetical protein
MKYLRYVSICPGFGAMKDSDIANRINMPVVKENKSTQTLMDRASRIPELRMSISFSN